MAEGLAEAGASLMLCARREEWLTPTVAKMRQQGFKVEGALCDVSKAADVQSVVDRTIAAYGRVDILINNAGVTWAAEPEDMTLAQWQKVVDINLTGAFLFAQAAGRDMLTRQWGRIINIASINALVAGRGIQGRHYEAAKGAMLQFTRAVAADWAVHKITANAILPGGFMTEPNRRWSELHPEVIERFRANIPLGEFGRPEDLGPLAVYLASDASRYMTGAALVIDGGYTLW